MISSRSVRVGAVLVAAAMAVAACSSGGDSSATTAGAPTAVSTAGGASSATTGPAVGSTGASTVTSPASATGTAAAGSTPSAGSSPVTFVQPTGDPDLNANFVYGYPITVSRLDPHKASISQDATTLFPVYDRLLDVTPTGELVPMLAESWEFSPDGLTLTMHVRPNVTFHDGAPLDATAVKTNLDRAKGIQGSSVATDLSSLDSVAVVDPMTVSLKLNTPNVAILGSLADRAGIQVSPKALADGIDLDTNMVGAGPYKMVSHVHGDTTKYERFDGYWDKAHLPKVKTLEIRVIADNAARLNAVKTGQISATTIGSSDVAQVENDSNLLLKFNTELAYTYIVENRSRAQQDDVRVRQALLYGLDRKSICDELLNGLCTLTDQPFPPGYFAYNPDIPQVLYPYDPDKAKQLMKEAGVTSLTVSMLTPAGLPTFPDIAEVIQSQWAELGVTVNIQPTDPTSLGQVMFADKQGDTMLAGWGGRPDPAITMNQRAGATSFANPGGVTTPKMTELLNQMMSTTDPAARQKVLQEGSAEMAQSALEMVVNFPKVAYVTGKNVVFTPYLSSKPEFRDVAIVKGG
jgi:peptide/nickel transport system substrate-binding protein